MRPSNNNNNNNNTPNQPPPFLGWRYVRILRTLSWVPPFGAISGSEGLLRQIRTGRRDWAHGPGSKPPVDPRQARLAPCPINHTHWKWQGGIMWMRRGGSPAPLQPPICPLAQPCSDCDSEAQDAPETARNLLLTRHRASSLRHPVSDDAKS